jgi:hypothetical protein
MLVFGGWLLGLKKLLLIVRRLHLFVRRVYIVSQMKSFSDASSTSKLERNEAEIETLTGLASELEKKVRLCKNKYINIAYLS